MSMLKAFSSRAFQRPVTSRARNVTTRATSVVQFVDDSIKNNKVVVFSKTFCPFCTKAKTALDSVAPGKYTVIEINGNPDMDEIQDTLAGITGGRSVPRVFVDGKFIGGGDDTARMAKNGELKTMLDSAGVV
eukprot:gene23788-9349_t